MVVIFYLFFLIASTYMNQTQLTILSTDGSKFAKTNDYCPTFFPQLRYFITFFFAFFRRFQYQ